MRFLKTEKKKKNYNVTNGSLAPILRQTLTRSPFENNSLDDTTKEAKEHILRRQQRIQQHHYQRIMTSSSSSVAGYISRTRSSLERMSLDSSQTSSPISKSSSTNYPATVEGQESSTSELKNENLGEINNEDIEDNEGNFIYNDKFLT